MRAIFFLFLLCPNFYRREHGKSPPWAELRWAWQKLGLMSAQVQGEGQGQGRRSGRPSLAGAGGPALVIRASSAALGSFSLLFFCFPQS